MSGEQFTGRCHMNTPVSDKVVRPNSPEQFESIIHTLIDSYWDLDIPSGKIKFTTGANSILGYAPQTFAPDLDSFWSLVHPEDKSCVENSFQGYLNGHQQFFQYEFRIRAKSGSYVWVLSRAVVAERDDDGKPKRLVGIHVDITDRRLLEQALQETSNAFQALFEDSPFGVVLTRLNGEYYDVNAKFASFVDRDRREIIGKQAEDFGVVLDVDKSDLIKALQEKGIVEGQHASVRRNSEGKVIHLVFTARMTTVAGVTMVLTILNDVTDLVNAEVDRAVVKERLRQNEAMLRTVLDSIPVRVFWKDTELNYLGCNMSFARDAGHNSPEELIGKDDYQMGWRQQAELYRADDQEVIRTGITKAGVEEPQTTPIGDTIWLRTTKTPLRDADGRVTGILGTYEDITKSKETEERLARAEKMQALGLLAGGVAHDLNNMLGPLVGYPELMIRKLPADSPLINTVKRIERAAIDATEMVEDLLTLARRGRYEMTATSLNHVVTAYLESTHFLRITSEKPAIRVKTDLDESLPQISGSKVHLGKLIMNIVGNAFEAMNDSGEIQIKTSTVELSRLRSGLGKVTPGIYVTLSIRDTGHGIAVEDRQKIFEPYFSRKQMGKSGSGLGLAVVYGVVKDHSGYYDLLSEVGVGTEFLFYFPLKSDFESREECKARSKTGKCVLVVDDSSMAREQTMQMLRSMGHIVASVPNGHEAVKYLQDRPVDLIVLDMLMEPDFDGLDTYQEILKVRPGQKVIVVSGYLESDRAQAILRAGAIALLRKPLTADALSVAMREAMGIAALP